MRKHFLSVLLIFALILTTCVPMTAAFAEDQGNCVNVELTVDGAATPIVVKAYYASYTYNAYVSVEDLAYALKGTDKNFNVTYDEVEGQWVFTTGEDFVGAAPVPFEKTYIEDTDAFDDIELNAYDVLIDGNVRQLRFYDNYDYGGGATAGAYMRLIDLGLFLDLPVNHDGYGKMSIDTSKDFTIDLEQLDANGYFKDLDGVYLGDVTTGKKLYGWDDQHATEIASTSKLMTMAIVLDKIAAGELSYDTIYSVSQEVVNEANSEDGTFYKGATDTDWGDVEMWVGQTWTVEDLLHAMMLPSANEAATALAEVVAGSEADFVELMNEKAADLGMTTAKFYNPHGLPHYEPSQFTGKMQNSMSAEDMFKLCSYLLTEHYDATVAITGDQEHQLTSLADDYAAKGMPVEDWEEYPYVATTYGTLHKNFKNTEGTLIGLKTGSTNRSGSCIVVAEVVKVAGEDHVLVGVSFGGEDNRQRYESSTVLLKYGQQWAAQGGQAPEEGEGTDPGVTPPTGDSNEPGNEAPAPDKDNGTTAPEGGATTAPGEDDAATTPEGGAAATPETGDQNSMLPYAGVIILALAGAACTVAYKKREN